MADITPALTSHELVEKIFATLLTGRYENTTDNPDICNWMNDARAYMAERNETKKQYIFVWETGEGDMKAKVAGTNKGLAELLFNMMVKDPNNILSDAVLMAAAGRCENLGSPHITDDICKLVHYHQQTRHTVNVHQPKPADDGE